MLFVAKLRAHSYGDAVALDDAALGERGLTVTPPESAWPYGRNTVMEEVAESSCIGRCLYGLLRCIADRQARSIA